MSERIHVGDAQYLEQADYNRMGELPQNAMDDLVGDVIAYRAGWASFTVSLKAGSVQEIVVSPGRYYNGRIVYAARDSQTIPLITEFPTAQSDEIWIALILRGEEADRKEKRAFETSEDPETSIPVDRIEPVVKWRKATVVIQRGAAVPAPARKPEIAETDACLAFIRLTTLGVQEIVPGLEWRAKPLSEVEARVTGIEIQFNQIQTRTETLETGMANANAAIADIRAQIPRREVIREMRRDIAAMRRQLNVPEGARSTYYDPALTMEMWDATHAQWLARVDEGIQMPFSFSKEARLEILNEDDPNIRIVNRRMVPAFDRVKRIYNEGGRATRLVSQLTHVEIEALLRTVSRVRYDYGPPVIVCENMAEWNRYNPQLESGKTFQKDGETFVGEFLHEQEGHGTTHTVFAVRSVKKKTYTSTYWEYQSKTVGLNGSTYGQTYLVDQPLIIESVELEFANIGTDGAVHLLLCGTDDTGAPLVGEIFAHSTIEHADLKVGWNVFEVDLTNVPPGGRYAWYIVTTGNHRIYGTDNNAFTGGTSFRFTDGIWAQGDLTFDFNFRVNGARFKNSRTVVQFKAMDLPEGMTQFKLLYPSWEPEGTAVAWEIQPVYGGQDMPWTRLVPGVDDNPLVGLPGQVNLRATLLATPDLAPMIELSADAVYKSARTHAEMRAVSVPLDFGLTTTSVETLTVVDEFDPAIHTFTPRIMVAGDSTLRAPDSSTTVIDEDKPSRRSILSRYTVPAGTQVVRTVPGGSTTNIVDPFFIENTAIYAL